MAQFGSLMKISMLVFMSVAVVALILSQHVSSTADVIDKTLEKKTADDKQSAECSEGRAACTWNKVKSFSNSAFQKIPFPSREKTAGEVVMGAASKSYEMGKKSAEDTGEKIKHTFGTGTEEL